MPARTSSRRARSANHSPTNLIRGSVGAYISRHGQARAAADLRLSRQTIWRFLERGHVGLVAHRTNALGPQAQRRYFPTPKGIIAAGQPTGIPVTSGGCADGSSVATLVP
ncbi:MAG: hypothetical protein OXE02_12975 [Chloroflexi bacterium]|nr:hypothetical protein [Chloroflexota bacterium]